MLPAPAGAQPLETIPRGDREFEEIPHAIHLIELPPGDRPQVARARPPGCGGIGAIKDVLGTAVPEGPYHSLHYSGSRYSTRVIRLAALQANPGLDRNQEGIAADLDLGYQDRGPLNGLWRVQKWALTLAVQPVDSEPRAAAHVLRERARARRGEDRHRCRESVHRDARPAGSMPRPGCAPDEPDEVSPSDLGPAPKHGGI